MRNDARWGPEAEDAPQGGTWGGGGGTAARPLTTAAHGYVHRLEGPGLAPVPRVPVRRVGLGRASDLKPAMPLSNPPMHSPGSRLLPCYVTQ